MGLWRDTLVEHLLRPDHDCGGVSPRDSGGKAIWSGTTIRETKVVSRRPAVKKQSLHPSTGGTAWPPPEISHAMMTGALTADQCLLFLQELFTVDASVTADMLEPFRGRPSFFFKFLLPALLNHVVQNKLACLDAQAMHTVCAAAFRKARNVVLDELNAILQDYWRSRFHDPLSATRALLIHCYVSARLSGGSFRGSPQQVMDLAATGLVRAPDAAVADPANASQDFLEVDLRAEPIVWSALELSAINEAFQDHLAQREYSGVYLLAWALMRRAQQPFLQLPGIRSATFARPSHAWLNNLTLAHSVALSLRDVKGCALFALHDASDPAAAAAAVAAGVRPPTLSPDAAASTIVFPQADMGPDLLLYFPAKGARDFPIVVSIRVKASEQSDLLAAFYSVNPGMFYAENRERFLYEPLIPDSRMREWTSAAASHRDVRFVRVIFSVGPFPEEIVRQVDEDNNANGIGIQLS